MPFGLSFSDFHDATLQDRNGYGSHNAVGNLCMKQLKGQRFASKWMTQPISYNIFWIIPWKVFIVNNVTNIFRISTPHGWSPGVRKLLPCTPRAGPLLNIWHAFGFGTNFVALFDRKHIGSTFRFWGNNQTSERLIFCLHFRFYWISSFYFLHI